MFKVARIVIEWLFLFAGGCFLLYEDHYKIVMGMILAFVCLSGIEDDLNKYIVELKDKLNELQQSR